MAQLFLYTLQSTTKLLTSILEGYMRSLHRTIHSRLTGTYPYRGSFVAVPYRPISCRIRRLDMHNLMTDTGNLTGQSPNEGTVRCGQKV